MTELNNLQNIRVADIDPHPQNPRIAIREDVVAAIAENLSGGFDPAHALIVRSVGGRHQVISGHHRLEAAKRAGLPELPCWVRDMDDDAAYMALVTSNAQGELSPLEIGLHALHCVALSKGGRGQTGGVRQYADRIGRDEKTVRQCKDAASVAEYCGVDPALSSKTAHLSAIHALPPEAWQPAVEAMLAWVWSAKDTSDMGGVA